MSFEEKNKGKYMTTFPYPYMNGYLHLGKSHTEYTWMRLEMDSLSSQNLLYVPTYLIVVRCLLSSPAHFLTNLID